MPFYLAWIISNFNRWNFKFFSNSELSYGTNQDFMPSIQAQFFVAQYPQKLYSDGQGNWLMGPSEHIGTKDALIFSALGNQCPFKLQSVFWNMNYGGLGWLAIPEFADCDCDVINIDCLKN